MPFLSAPFPFRRAAEIGPLDTARAKADQVPPEVKLGPIPPAAWPPPDDGCWENLGASRAELAALYDSLKGFIYFPGLHGYDAARSADQSDYAMPRVIAFCRSAHDVKTCLKWARERDWLISVRSGGHNTAGFHLSSGLVIDVQFLKEVTINGDTVTVGAGASWGAIYQALHGSGRFLLGGTCPHVAAAGYTMGGGYSIVSRLFGLTCDHLRSATLMTAEGNVIEASAEREPDLFWALRGGGGGQFGVLLSLTFALQQPDKFFGFVLNWRLDHAEKVLAHLETYHTTKESPQFGYLAAMTALTREGGWEEETSLSILGLHAGSEADALKDLEALTAVAPHTWRVKQTGEYLPLHAALFHVLPYGALRLFDAGRLEITGYVGSEGKPDWKQLVELARKAPNPGNLIAFEPYGGMIASSQDSAFPHRDQKLNMKINSYWRPDWQYNTTRHSAQEWLDGAMDAIRPALSGRVYVNYMNRDVSNYRDAYWGDSFKRLLGVKQRYDPKNVFRFPFSLRP